MRRSFKTNFDSMASPGVFAFFCFSSPAYFSIFRFIDLIPFESFRIDVASPFTFMAEEPSKQPQNVVRFGIVTQGRIVKIYSRFEHKSQSTQLPPSGNKLFELGVTTFMIYSRRSSTGGSADTFRLSHGM